MYLKINNGVIEYPYQLERVLTDNPNVSFSVPLNEQDLSAFGVFPVEPSHPSLVPSRLTEKAVEIDPVLVNGTWTQQWEIVELTADEQQQVALQVKQEIINSTQARLDDFAKTRLYDGILSLCTYATDTNPKFATEGQYGVTARSETWATLYTILAEVEAGTRPFPSGYIDIESELPVLAWPQ